MNNLSKLGVGLAMTSMTYLAWLLLTSSTPLNLATWILWFAIDFAVILSLYRAKKAYEIMVAFTVGTGCIVAIATYNFVVGNAQFSWGGAETATVVGVVIALIAWKFTNDNVGVIMTTLSMAGAGIPTWIDAFHRPESQSVLFWTMSAGACFLTCMGSPRSFMDRFMPGVGTITNVLILGLALRQFA